MRHPESRLSPWDCHVDIAKQGWPHVALLSSVRIPKKTLPYNFPKSGPSIQQAHLMLIIVMQSRYKPFTWESRMKTLALLAMATVLSVSVYADPVMTYISTY